MSEVQIWKLSKEERQAIIADADKLGEKHVKALWEQMVRQAGSESEVDRLLSLDN